MTLSEDVVEAVRRDEDHAIASLLAGRTEKERVIVARALKEYLKELPPRAGKRNTAFVLAVFGAGSRAIGVSRLLDWPHQPEYSAIEAAQILIERNPVWLADLPAALLETRYGTWWALIRELVLRGALPTPEHPNYTREMVGGWRQRTSSVAQMLADDPDLLADEVLRLFRTEGAGERLHWHDSHAGKKGDDWRWSACIQRFLPRPKVIHLVFSALSQDWPGEHMRWYVDLHRRLQPDHDEVTAHQGAYRAMLTTAPRAAVELAQDVFSEVITAGRLDIDAFLDVADAPLHHPVKPVALRQIELLRALAEAAPDRMPSCAGAVVPALLHPHAAVREAGARALLDLNAAADPDLAAEVRDCLRSLGGVAADLLIPTFAPSEPDLTYAPVPEPRRTPMAVDRTKLPPLNAAEIEDALVHLLEDADDPLLLEQVLDFMAKNPDRRPTDAALLKRASSRPYWVRPYAGTDLRADLAELIVSRMTGRPPTRNVYVDGVPYFDGWIIDSVPDGSTSLSLGTIVSSRLRELALVAARGRPRNLLATPTYTDGTLSADDLRARLDELVRSGEDLLPMDVETAVLRSGHAAATEVLSTTHRPDDLLTRAVADLECALDWQRCTGKPGGTSNLSAAFPSLYRNDLRPPMVVWRLPGAPAGRLDRLIASLFDLDDPLAHAGYRWDESEPGWSHLQVVACWPLVAPHHVDVVMAQAHPMLCRNVWEVRDAAVPLVQSLASCTTPPGEPTWSALGLALSGKNAMLRTAAVDAFAGLVSSNLLDGFALGRACGHHAGDDMIVVQRLLGSLREAAEVDAACTWRVLDTLDGLLPGLVGHRDLGRAALHADDLAQRCGRSVSVPSDSAASRAAAKTLQRLAERTDIATPTRMEAAGLLSGPAR